MKRNTKLGLIGGTLLLGAVVLSGCTSSFCSTLDKAHMMYAFDFGVTTYYESEEVAPAGSTAVTIAGSTFYKYSDIESCPALKTILASATKQDIAVPSINYFASLDEVVLNYIVSNETIGEVEVIDYCGVSTLNILKEFGFYKFYYNIPYDMGQEGAEKLSPTHTGVRWANWDYLNNQAKLDPSVPVDELPNNDYVAFYKSRMLSLINSYRSCIATNTGEYGFYGTGSNKTPIEIEAKSYGYGWSRGFFEGLLIWPIGALAGVITNGFLMAGVATGLASVLAIIVVTLIIRSLLLVFTLKQNQDQAKMTQLQPELAKIQAKYPNSKTSRNEQMRLADETQKLYKKHGVHPLRTFLSLIIQFPVFICVWGGIQGSAALSTGSFLGLNLSESIWSVMFNGSNWANGSAITALVLFLLMAGAQALSMLIPQYLQKKRVKKVARLGKNPAAQQNEKRMKIFQYAMLGMIIIMGFSLASGMGVYWFISAIFSLIQSLITHTITMKKKKEKR